MQKENRWPLFKNSRGNMQLRVLKGETFSFILPQVVFSLSLPPFLPLSPDLCCFHLLFNVALPGAQGLLLGVTTCPPTPPHQFCMCTKDPLPAGFPALGHQSAAPRPRQHRGAEPGFSPSHKPLTPAHCEWMTPKGLQPLGPVSLGTRKGPRCCCVPQVTIPLPTPEHT